jgi:hypothetical protein
MNHCDENDDRGIERHSLLVQTKYTVQIDTSAFVSQITANGLESRSKLAVALAIVMFTTYASRLHRPSKNAQVCGRTQSKQDSLKLGWRAAHLPYFA